MVSYGKFENNGSASCPGLQYKVQAIGSAGDVYRGYNTPGSLPYSSCHADPYGADVVPYSGNWAQDTAKAVDCNTVASAFGFNFGGHTGYTSGIKIRMHNGGSSNTYVCGTPYLPGVPVVYNRGY